MKITNKLAALFTAGVLLFFASSCQQPASSSKSSEKQLTLFGFTASANNALSDDVAGIINQSTHTVIITVPSGTAVNMLVATFACSIHASVSINGTPQTSGITDNSFEDTVIYTVTAEDGSTNMYSVTVTASGSGSGSGSSEINENCLDGIWVSDIPLSGDYCALKFTVSSKTAAGNTGTTKEAAIAAITGSFPYTYSGTTATISHGSSTIDFKLTSSSTADYYIEAKKLGPFTKQSSSGSGNGSTKLPGEASDSICESVIQLPAGTDGSAGTNGTYVLFGSWPQTIKASSVSISATQTKTMGTNIYYLGSNGYWYAKAKAAPYGTDYTLTNGSTITSGTEYYFKVEPIKWRVLERGKLLAENILINAAYYPYGVNRTIGSKTVYPNNYQYSRIRAYLNGLSYTEKSSDAESQTDNTEFSNKGFLQTAFTAAARAKIATTTVDNSGASTTDSDSMTTGVNGDGTNQYACDNTSDKIYLLSEFEVTNSKIYKFGVYNATDTLRRRTVSDYARATGAYMYTLAGEIQYRGIWFLRSPRYNDSSCALAGGYDGYANDSVNVYCSNYGVVPALSLL